jgi:hypothetical protein
MLRMRKAAPADSVLLVCNRSPKLGRIIKINARPKCALEGSNTSILKPESNLNVI